MFEGLSIADQVQLFGSSLIMYKGVPCKVRSISGDARYRLFNLIDRKEVIVSNAHLDITPLYMRLGMVNGMGSCAYIQRRPVRQYSVGLTHTNILVHQLPIGYPDGWIELKTKILNLDSEELLRCLLDKYPSLKEAAAEAEHNGGATAFDKQFAIGPHREIYYKTVCVGELPKNRVSVSQIKFKPGNEHLCLLLEGNYEKDLRAFSPKA